MAKRFRRWEVEQRWLLPPSVKDLVPEDHPAHFVRELVRNDLDLSAILDGYTEERGQPPFHPVMMVALLLYAYTQRVYSSRRIAKACQERVDFMAVTAMQSPDFRTVNLFRQRHLVSAAATGYASRLSNRSSAKSRRPEGSEASCCAGSQKSRPSGA